MSKRKWEVVHVPKCMNIPAPGDFLIDDDELADAMRSGALKCGTVLAHGPRRYIVYRLGGEICLLRARCEYDPRRGWIWLADTNIRQPFSHCVIAEV